MTKLCEGRVAIITGGKRIGSVVAITLAQSGADIGLCYNRSRDEAEKTAVEVEKLGRRAFVRQADLTLAADCEAFVNESVSALGRLDVLVNMASIYEQAAQSAPRGGVRRKPRRRLARGVRLRAGRVATHAARRRRSHHQFFRLAVA